jgi:hypothetical protein
MIQKKHSSPDPKESVYYEIEKRQYRIRFEKALSATLLCIIVLFVVFRRSSLTFEVKWRKNKYEVIQVDFIPTTQRIARDHFPTMPTVPLFDEVEIFPEDEELDLKDISPADVFSDMDEIQIEDVGLTKSNLNDNWNAESGMVVLRLLINQYGRVDSVRVEKNTTRSKSFEAEAINMAFRGRYLFEDGRMQESRWIERSYWFKKK